MSARTLVRRLFLRLRRPLVFVSYRRNDRAQQAEVADIDHVPAALEGVRVREACALVCLFGLVRARGFDGGVIGGHLATQP